MKIKDKRFKITALYERLSKDDEVQGESNSIVNHDVMYRGWITPKNITSWKANFYGLLNQTFAVITLHLICTSRSTRLTPNKI